MGCDIAQGYFIARPMSLEKLKDYLSVSDETMPASRRARAG
jgi:EAL domain-containing protein (putative c-di-GMP-specific phosphodiesterase class I)